MADNSRLPLKLADSITVVIGDLLNPLAGKDLRVVMCLYNGLRVIGPARREGRIALLFKERAPVVPTGCEEIETMHEDGRLPARAVGTVDFLLLMVRENC